MHKTDFKFQLQLEVGAAAGLGPWQAAAAVSCRRQGSTTREVPSANARRRSHVSPGRLRFGGHEQLSCGLKHY